MALGTWAVVMWVVLKQFDMRLNHPMVSHMWTRSTVHSCRSRSTLAHALCRAPHELSCQFAAQRVVRRRGFGREAQVERWGEMGVVRSERGGKVVVFGTSEGQEEGDGAKQEPGHLGKLT